MSPARRWGGRLRTHLACLGAIVALTLVWFAPVLGGKAYSTVGGHENAVYPWSAQRNGLPDSPQSDQADLTYPIQVELTTAVRAGTIPWWNPESFGGQPLFSDGSSALLYPPKLLLALVASPTSAHDALSMLDVALAGIFSYLLLVELGLEPLAALFGAIAWMFGSYTLAWLQLEVVAPVFAWLPAGLLAVRKAVRQGGRFVVAAGAAIALLLLGAHLLYAIVCVTAIACYGLCVAGAEAWRARGTGVRGPAQPIGRLALAGGLGVGLAAAVLVPTAEVLDDVSRSAFSFSTLESSFLLSWSDLRTVIWPAALPVSQFEMNWQMGFSGTATAVLACVGLLVRRPGAGLGRGLIVGSVLAAVGGPVTFLVFHLVPGMDVFRPYSRLLFLFDLGVAILGGLGLDAVLRALKGETAVLGWRRGLGERRRTVPLALRVGTSGLLVAIVALTALQLGWYGRRVNPPFEPDTAADAYPPTPLTRALSSGTSGIPGWPVRVLPARNASSGWAPPMLYSNESLALGIDSAGGYDSSVPTRTVDVWLVAADEAPATVVGSKLVGAFQPLFFAQDLRLSLLPVLGVDRIALTPAAARSSARAIEAAGWRRVYRGRDGTVLAYDGPPTGPHVVFGARDVPDDLAALDDLVAPGFDAETTVLLDGDEAAGGPGRGRASVTRARTSFDSVALTLRSSASGWLVVPDMWDAGWRATVNGRPASVLRGDYDEQVVAIPAGRDSVDLDYSPPGLRLGAALSALSALVCLAVLLPRVGRRRRRAAEAAATDR